ncbi:MAG: hypothetical protein NTZ09_04930 [Candidatus Hydrogenedentes bacterium]|nr:hypothetical protein [Candidatus Hydrogenedentota bacterium]
MNLARQYILDTLFYACMAAMAVAGSVEELKRPEPIWLPLAAMACAAAVFLPLPARAWKPELTALAVAFCAVSAGRLAVAVGEFPGLGDVALRPGAAPVLALGVARLVAVPRSDCKGGLWRLVFLCAAAAVTAGLCGGYLLISRYHALEVSTLREALFNAALVVAAYLAAAPFLEGSGNTRRRTLSVAITAFSLLAAGLAGRYV